MEPALETISDPEITMELALQEDVNAELEDFLLLSLLGIDDEARDVARAVLWRHLRHFSVFAEIAGFAIDRNDSALLNELITTMREAGVEFDSRDEMLFLHVVDAVARYKPTIAGIVPWDLVLNPVSQDPPSSIMCQLYEMRVIVMAQHLHEEIDPTQSVNLCERFLDSNMLTQAAHFFSSAVVALQTSKSLLQLRLTRTRFGVLFRELARSLDIKKPCGDVEISEEAQALALMVRLSYLRALEAFLDSLEPVEQSTIVEHVDTVLQGTQQLLLDAFEGMPNSEPRGQQVEYCMALESKVDLVMARLRDEPDQMKAKSPEARETLSSSLTTAKTAQEMLTKTTGISDTASTDTQMDKKTSPMSYSPTFLTAGLSPNTQSPLSNKKHECPYCSTEFTRHHNLQTHLLTHSQEKPYVCSTCQSRFRRLHDLKRHTILHTGKRPHVCPKCNRKFARGDDLFKHNKGPGGCTGRNDDGDDDNEGMEDVMYGELENMGDAEGVMRGAPKTHTRASIGDENVSNDDSDEFPFTVIKSRVYQSFIKLSVQNSSQLFDYLENHTDILIPSDSERPHNQFFDQCVDFLKMGKHMLAYCCAYCDALIDKTSLQEPSERTSFLVRLRFAPPHERQLLNSWARVTFALAQKSLEGHSVDTEHKGYKRYLPDSPDPRPQQKKRTAAKERAKSSQNTTLDNEEQFMQGHTDVQHVFTPSEPTDLAIRRNTTTSFPDQSQPHEEADKEHPRYSNESRSIPFPETSPALLTKEELERLERYTLLQQRPGNKYHKLTVQGQGRAIRGDIHDPKSPEMQSFAPYHVYDSTQLTSEDVWKDSDQAAAN